MNFPKKVIYMADDDADDRFFMTNAFRAYDPSVRIVESEDGQELLTRLNSLALNAASPEVSLILLDMNMPKLNGLEALKAIKANERLRHIPVVIISTSLSPDLVSKAYEYGINSCIQKPMNYTHIDQLAWALRVCFLNGAVA